MSWISLTFCGRWGLPMKRALFGSENRTEQVVRQLTEPAHRVQTFLDSTVPPEAIPAGREFLSVVQCSRMSLRRLPLGLRAFGGPTTCNSNLAEEISCTISSQWQHLWSCPPILARKPPSSSCAGS